MTSQTSVLRARRFTKQKPFMDFVDPTFFKITLLLPNIEKILILSMFFGFFSEKLTCVVDVVDFATAGSVIGDFEISDVTITLKT